MGTTHELGIHRPSAALPPSFPVCSNDIDILPAPKDESTSLLEMNETVISWFTQRFPLTNLGPAGAIKHHERWTTQMSTITSCHSWLQHNQRTEQHHLEPLSLNTAFLTALSVLANSGTE